MSLIEPRFLSTFALNDGGSVTRRRFSHLKLPLQCRIKLSVVKLNDSLFDVEVPKDCTVAERKRAVEEVPCLGSFFACVIETRDYSMTKQASILHFVRHLSIDHSPMNKRSKNPSCKRYLELEMESNAYQIQVPNQYQNSVVNVTEKYHPGAQDELPAADFRLVNLIKEWLPYAGKWGVEKRT